MINPASPASRNRSSGLRPERALLLAAVGLGLLLLPAGCKKKEEPAPVVVEAPPEPPPPPQPTVAELMTRYNIDPRISIAQDEIPVDEQNPEMATKKLVAVLQFFDAMVRGSDAKWKPMLASADQKVLAELVQQGLLAPAAKEIDVVLLGCGTLQMGFDSSEAVFALIQSGSRFDAQLWSFAPTPGSEDQFTFEAAPTPPDVLNHLSGTKAGPRIRQWGELIKTKLEEAKRPDEVIVMPTLDYSETVEESTSPGGNAPRPGSTPSDGEPGRKVNPGGVPAPRPPPIR